MKKRLFASAAVILVIIAAVFGIYVSIYYHADSSAKKMLVSDADVTVSETDFGWIFDGPSSDTALVFYPGAKVETEAYAPLAHLLAEKGSDVCLVDMPFRLAFFDINAADDIMARYDYSSWYVGGHSLGGAMAAVYAADNGDKLEGVVLCAAYPTKELDKDLTEVVIYGSEDEVVNMEKIRDGEQYAPEDYNEFMIEGGNHAQFGSYGEQKGDGDAYISAEQQREEAVRVIMECFRNAETDG